MTAGVGQAFADSLSAPMSAVAELRSHAQGEAVSVPATNEQRADLFRQSPVLSGRLRVSDQTLIPYIGAGFGGGYVTERDRASEPTADPPAAKSLRRIDGQKHDAERVSDGHSYSLLILPISSFDRAWSSGGMARRGAGPTLPDQLRPRLWKDQVRIGQL